MIWWFSNRQAIYRKSQRLNNQHLCTYWWVDCKTESNHIVRILQLPYYIFIYIYFSQIIVWLQCWWVGRCPWCILVGIALSCYLVACAWAGTGWESCIVSLSWATGNTAVLNRVRIGVGTCDDSRIIRAIYIVNRSDLSTSTVDTLFWIWSTLSDRQDWELLNPIMFGLRTYEVEQLQNVLSLAVTVLVGQVAHWRRMIS